MIRPDKWVIIEWTMNGNAFKKVLASHDSNGSWELSHIITNIEDMDDYWEISTRNGHIYKCVKLLQGLSTVTATVYGDMVKKAKADSKLEIGIGIISM